MQENRTTEKIISTKEKIINSSKRLFSEHGYKATSVRKIASDVGIRESALYNHFKNKEDIFLTVAKDIFSSPFSFSHDEIKDAALKGKVFLNKYAMQYKLLTFDKNNESMFRILLIELLQNKELREQFMSEFHDKNIKVLSEGFFIMMQNDLIRSSDPMMLSYEFLSTLFYIRLQITLIRYDSISTTSLSTQFEKHVDFFWESIRK
ncbi:MAG: TetR/AcrR family transcriptional regulator [Sulfurimonas sp.]|jgi:AcrR family transcriptional regulator|nr:TetR/AcrR family transcriptional regulator [Sulfurimonas sp.]MBU1216211.1 TetR/AcrR family transcriptional regulator [bacterium]MBU1434517.1 TetR/AcrR family transcriptional regulator [bacterium]MBU1502095.1 TetR/AcrR family transcriptional regulator [bacterium]MBU3937929.1 TetR/AcrR family transcriptional regulator [bacterium]